MNNKYNGARVRFIPRLDIKGPNLVKGIHLEGLRAIGKPADFARYYYENGADELLFMDVVASLYERNSLENLIQETSKDVLVPMTVGGGLRTLEDIDRVLSAGADKVSINTAAVRNPVFIEQAAKKFGSSTIVVAIEAIQVGKQFFAFTDNGREETGLDVVEWAKKVESLGAGEIIITSVDREGTGKGFHTELIQKVADVTTLPIVAHGGAGHASHVVEMLSSTSASAVSVASILHYNAMNEIKNQEVNSQEGNFRFVSENRVVKRLEPTTIPRIKHLLIENDIPVRPPVS